MILAVWGVMLATALATTLVGMEAHLVRVEVEASRGPGSFELVGLPEASVRESRVRVRTALSQLGICLDEHRIVVNLSPGDVRKAGSSFDLAIAAATLASLGELEASTLEGLLLLGELSLYGELRPVQGLLPQLLFARQSGLKTAIVPVSNGAEASVVGGLSSLVASELAHVVEHLDGKGALSPAERPPLPIDAPIAQVDMADVRGQQAARRALEIAAAGHHHMLMVGAPGGGKTMLAKRLPTIMPPLTHEEALEVTAIHSVAGTLPSHLGLLRDRPFRAPHHTVSDAGLVGGGAPPRPGELSLSHHGVLFLDELPEFSRSSLEALRQPLEDGDLVIARARTRARFPARPLLVGAANPCPCGYHRDGSDRCRCTIEAVRRYIGRLSGPMLDRIDLHVHLPPVAVDDLAAGPPGEASSSVRARVVRARAVQGARAERGEVSATTNAALSPRDLEVVATPGASGQRLLRGAIERLGLSARAYGKVLRVSRTIADLAGSDAVEDEHLAEAIGLRVLERKLS